MSWNNPQKFKSGELAADKLRNERKKLGDLDISYLTGGQGDPLIVIHGGG